MSQWFSCVWATQPVRWMNRETSADTYHTISQTDFSCRLSAGVYSHSFIDSAPSSGQRHNKRNHFPFLNMILSMGSWEMEKKIHITLAGQRDLSCASAEFPYLDFSVTKACSICGKSWKNNYWDFLFSSLVSSWGEGGRERKGGARKERPSLSFAVSFHFFSALYCSFSVLCKRILQT